MNLKQRRCSSARCYLMSFWIYWHKKNDAYTVCTYLTRPESDSCTVYFNGDMKTLCNLLRNTLGCGVMRHVSRCQTRSGFLWMLIIHAPPQQPKLCVISECTHTRNPPTHPLISIMSHVFDSSTCKCSSLGGVWHTRGGRGGGGCQLSQHCALHFVGKTNIYNRVEGSCQRVSGGGTWRRRRMMTS